MMYSSLPTDDLECDARKKDKTWTDASRTGFDRLSRAVQRSSCGLASIFLLVVVAVALISTLGIGNGGDAGQGTTEGVLKRHWSLSPSDQDANLVRSYRAPEGVQVKALVFFGRRRTAAMLSCFLERNLKRNGGVLDEVVWLEGTSKADEVAWMHDLVNSTEGFSTFYSREFAVRRNYAEAYSIAFNETYEGETVYVKIDDDVVFLDDAAIPTIVQRLLTDPTQPFIVGANVVNQPALSWVHHGRRAIEGYMPELSRAPTNDSLPAPVPAYDDVLPTWSAPSSHYRVPANFRAPRAQHRWLPTNASLWPMDRTPIAQVDLFSPWGKALRWWPIGAQQHYSLLGRMARNDMSPMKFDVWDFNYVRMGIQFYAIRRTDVMAHYPLPDGDDERYLSIDAPRKEERRAIVDGRNVVAHYSFHPQYTGIDSTDILQRYASFAERNICSSPASKASVRKESVR